MIFQHTNTTHSLNEKLEMQMNNGSRHYQTPEGNVYPSVTTVTSLYSKDSILEWRKRVGEEEANRISSKASRRGTRVHKICEDYLMNEPLESSILPDALAMFKSIQLHYTLII